MGKKDRKIARDIPVAELEVLSVLWRLDRGTVRDVREELHRRGRRLAHTTVLTLFERLERKGYVECDRDGPANIYRPTISREQVTTDRLAALVDQLGEGRVAPLVLRLVEMHDLSPEDIHELRQLLSRLEAENRKRKKRRKRQSDETEVQG